MSDAGKYLDLEDVIKQVGESRNNKSSSKDISKDIVAAMCAGDQDAYRKIYMRYEKSFRKFLSSLTRSQETAKDISQEVFISLWEKRHLIDSDKSIVKYLYKMGKNAVYQMYRHNIVHNKYSTHLLSQEQNESPGSDSWIINRETELLINIAVSRMPEQRKKIFELKHYGGLSSQNIAEQLHLSHSTVRTHLQLALKDIKKILKIFVLFFFS